MLPPLLVLKPHPSHSPAPLAELEARISLERERSALRLRAKFRYSFRESARPVLPVCRGSSPQRQDELWTSTCFELFIQPEVFAPSYWEVNVAPSGDWNVYAFDDYRQGIRREESVEELRLTQTESNSTSLVCAFSIPVPGPAIVKQKKIRVGVTAVIESQDGSKTYWALEHHLDRPDFHRPESFVYSLDPLLAVSVPS